MDNSQLNQYDLVLDGQYYLRELVESISLDDSLDEIAYRGTIRLTRTADLPEIKPGQAVEIWGKPFGGTGLTQLLAPGVVWEVEADTANQTHLTLQVYDKTIYLARSEDEYLFPAGQTAAQRLRKYAGEWQIAVGNVTDTGVGLARSVYRGQTIYAMINADLRETVGKGGAMYRPRMTPQGLELFKLGTNPTVWALEPDRNLEQSQVKSSLEGAVTRVKVFGIGPLSDQAVGTPVLGVAVGATGQYGTIQKVFSDSQARSAGEAEAAGRKLLCGAVDSTTVVALDINTIRAGDKIKFNNADWLTTSVSHQLGNPGRMILGLAPQDQVKRRYYSE